MVFSKKGFFLERIMTSQQWHEIDRLLKAAWPSEAKSGERINTERLREEIGVAISFYREYRPPLESDDNKLLDQMEHARNREQDSLEWLARTLGNQDFFKAVASGRGRQSPIELERQQTIQRKLQNVRRSKEWLRTLYDEAIGRVRHRRGRRSNRNIFDLFELLARTWKNFTGRPLSQSKRNVRWVWEVCNVAEPGVKESAVREGIKKEIREEEMRQIHQQEDRRYIFER
jgi:hypothetical protein